jgi:hypothetical protein
MREIAATFREAGLPGEFHDAAAEVFHRIDGLKGSDASFGVDQILSALINRTI